jgi:hypothetical protein
VILNVRTCGYSADVVLAGTKLCIQSPSAVRRADPAIMDRMAPGEDWEAAHGSSTIGLEAALGACREKALELELRLRSAEERIRLQVSLLAFCSGCPPLEEGFLASVTGDLLEH